MPSFAPTTRLRLAGSLCFAAALATTSAGMPAPELQPGEQVSLSPEIDAFIERLLADHGVPGVALAIVKGGEVVHKRCHGFASLEHEVPVRTNTVFQLFSLTKPMIAVGVYGLIESGSLNLDEPVGKHVEGLPEAWRGIELKHLIAHASGLPDMAAGSPYDIRDDTLEEAQARTFALPLQFAKGERYAYNQTNYWLLKEVLEKVSGQSLSDLILGSQFPDAVEGSAFFSNDARDIHPRRATTYFPWLKGRLAIDLPYTNGDYFLACNGLHVSLDEFIRWDAKLRSHALLSEESRAAMWEPYPYANDAKLFGAGWNIVESSAGLGYGFSGSLSTIYRTFPGDDLSIIFLSNGFAEMYSQDALVRELRDAVVN